KASFVVLLLPGLAAGRASFGVEPAVALDHLSKAAVEIAFDERASLRAERSHVLDFPLEAAVEVFPIGQLSGPLLRRLSSSSSSSSSSPPTTTACISVTSALIVPANPDLPQVVGSRRGPRGAQLTRGSQRGSVNFSVVGPPGLLSTSKVPPSIRTRSAIPTR